MEQLMWNYDFIHYMIAPNYYDDDPTHAHSRDYRILNQLHSVQENNPLVKRALFYSPISGQLYRAAPIPCWTLRVPTSGSSCRKRGQT